MSRRWILAVGLTLALTLAAALAAVKVTTASSTGGPPTYLVTVTNLTDGQPLTPPLVAVHKRGAGLFAIGRPASPELQALAENGNLDPLLAALYPKANRHVADLTIVARGAEMGAPIVPAGNPGETGFESAQAFIVTGGHGANYLTVASMLICTNDGFTGVNSVKLPRHVGDSATYFSAGYDAGTESNTEDFADLVPPCQGLVGISSDDPGKGMSDPKLAQNGVVRVHPGIVGARKALPDADLLPGAHGWTDPAVMVWVERIS